MACLLAAAVVRFAGLLPRMKSLEFRVQGCSRGGGGGGGSGNGGGGGGALLGGSYTGVNGLT